MIHAHQPRIFRDHLEVAAVSSLEDGNMGFRVPGSDEEIHDEWIRMNRCRWLGRLGVDPAHTALVSVTYGAEQSYDNFRSVEDADIGAGVMEPAGARQADGLVTDRKDVALFLPLADCNGLIMYDLVSRGLMVSHLGRHSTNVDGAEKSVAAMNKLYDSRPSDLLAWLSPGVAQQSYAMQAYPSDSRHHDFLTDERWRDHRQHEDKTVYIDLAGYNHDGLLRAGVRPEHIERSMVDTALHPEYPSHSQGHAARFAVVALRKKRF